MSLRAVVVGAALIGGVTLTAPMASAAPAAHQPPPAVGGPHCDESQRRGAWSEYEGESVSRIYDILFTQGARMPYLDRYTPQGLTTWPNWDGAGHTLLLLGMYERGASSYLVGINPETESVVGTVQVYESHLGAVAAIGDWLITQDTDTHPPQTVRRYRLDELRSAMAESAAHGTKPYLRSDGDPQYVFAAQFTAVSGNSIWLGRHSREGLSTMYRYAVDENGVLHLAEGPWVVPARLQGLVVTDEHFVFTADEARGPGQLTVFRRGAPPDLEQVACIRIPSMPENMTTYGGRLFASYEGGAAQYDLPGTTNRIHRLHSADLRALLRVADPTAFSSAAEDK